MTGDQAKTWSQILVRTPRSLAKLQQEGDNEIIVGDFIVALLSQNGRYVYIATI